MQLQCLNTIQVYERRALFDDIELRCAAILEENLEEKQSRTKMVVWNNPGVFDEERDTPGKCWSNTFPKIMETEEPESKTFIVSFCNGLSTETS